MRLKHFLSVFLTLLTLSVGQMWGANVSITASDLNGMGSSNYATGEKTVGDFTISATGCYGTTQFRITQNKTLTITCNTGTMTAITFTTSGTYTLTATNLTNQAWSDPNGQSSVSFTQTRNGAARITNIAITYSSSCSNKVTLTKGLTTNGTFDLDQKDGSYDNCDDNFVVHVSNIVPANNAQYCNGINVTGGNSNVTGPVDGVWTVTYTKGNNITSTITPTYANKTAASISFENAGTPAPTTSGYYVGDTYKLPSTNNFSCSGGKTFVGWSTVEVAETDTKPSSNFYEPGASVTLAASNTFYAVFAKASGGAATWDKVTTLAGITAGTYVIINDSKYLPSTATGSTTPPSQAAAPTITGTQITGTVTDAMKWYFTSTGTANQFYIQNEDDDYLYETSANNGLRVGSTSDKWTFAAYTLPAFSLQGENNSRYCATYSAGSDWRSYTTANAGNYGDGGKVYLYKLTGGTTYSAYSTTCCTPLGSINGSVDWTNPTTAVVTWDKLDDQVSAWALSWSPNTDGSSITSAITDKGETQKTATVSGLACGTDYTFTLTPTIKSGVCTVETNPTIVSSYPKPTITLDKVGTTNGDFSISGNLTSQCPGENVTVLLSPNSGYEVDALTIGETDYASSVSNNSYTFEMPSSNVTIHATFKTSVKPEVNVTATEGLTGTTLSYGNVAKETDKALTITVTGSNLTNDVTWALADTDDESAGMFSISPSSTTIGQSAATSGHDMEITFTPAAAKTYTATLTFSTTGAAANKVITLTGTGKNLYTVTFKRDGQVYDTKQAFDGETVTFPENDPEKFDNDYPNFIGWADAISGVATSAPTLKSASEVINANVEYHAVFGTTPVATGNYAKITTLGELTDGKYVIVGEASSKLAILESEVYSNYYVKGTALTLSEGKVANPVAASVLDFEHSEAGWSINYNATGGGYLVIKDGTGGHINLVPNQESAHYYSAQVTAGGVWTLASTTKTGSQIKYKLFTKDNNEYPEFTVESNDNNPIYLFKQEFTQEFVTRQIVKHTISYNKNTEDEVTGSLPANAIVVDGEDYTVSDATLSRAGYNFIGWNISNTATTAQTTLLNVTEDATLYAVWKQIPTYNIEFSVNGAKVEALKLADQLEGTAIAFPDAAAITAASAFPTTDKKFVGWIEASSYASDDAPTFVTSATATADKVYYAVFADLVSEGKYNKLTSTAGLTAGDKIVVTNGSSVGMKAFGQSSDNNFKGAEIEIEGNQITNLGEACELTLGGTAGHWTLFDGAKYVYAAGSAKSGSGYNNYMKGKDTKDAACEWTISIDGETTTIRSVENTATSYMRYNSSNTSVFSCYNTASQNAVVLFKKAANVYEDYVTNIATLNSIAITTAPKTVYKKGETLDLTGMVVKATYSDSRVRTLSSDKYTIDLADEALAESNNKFTVSYTEGETTKTAEQTIAVYELTSIAVTNEPATTIYLEGATFDKTGMEVTATWGTGADKIVETLDAEDYMVSPSVLDATSITSVTISYTHEGVTKTTTQAVTVNDRPSLTMSWKVGNADPTETKIYEEGGKYLLALPAEDPDPVDAGFTSDFEFKGWTADVTIAKSGENINFAEADDEMSNATTFHAVFALKNGEDAPAGYRLVNAAPANGETVIFARKVNNTYYAFNNSAGSSELTITDGVVTSTTDDVLWDAKEQCNTTTATGLFYFVSKQTTNLIHINSNAFNITNSAQNGDIVFSANGDGSFTAARRNDSGTLDRWISAYGPNAFGVTSTESSAVALYVFKYAAATTATYSNYRFAPSSVAAPVFGLTEGTYYGAQNVEITADKAIYYTLDGTNPTNASTPYSNAINLNEAGTKTVKVVAYDSESDDYSAIVSAEYTIVTEIDAPTMPATGKFYEDSKEVEISHELTSEGAEILYSYDGVNYSTYSSALNITETKTVYAKATIGSLTSEVVSATYTKGVVVNYSKLTSTNQLAAGMEFLIVAATNKVAGKPNTTASNPYLAYEEITPSVNTLAIKDEAVQVFLLDREPGAWSFGIDDGKFLVPSSGNIGVSATSSGEWSIAIADGGAPTITCTGNSDKNTLLYNKNNPRFKTYAEVNNTNAALDNLYYLPYDAAYTLTYNDANGDEIKSVKVVAGYEYTIVNSNYGVAPTGYEFLGKWTDGTNTYDINDKIVLTANTTLQPCWKVTTPADADINTLPTSVTEIVVTDGKTLTIGAAGRSLDNLTVEAGGKVTGSATLNVQDLTIKTSLGTISGNNNTGGKSGEILNPDNITANGDVWIEIELTQDAAASYGWYAFSVPFPVDALNGVYYGSTKLQNEVGYAIMSHYGELRAKNEYAWKKFRDIMQPGVFYVITVGNTDYKTLRFKKVAGKAIFNEGNVVNEDNQMATKEYASEIGDNHAGWNGLGNPYLETTKVGCTYLQFYDHGDNVFRQRTGSAVQLMVGSAFFYQSDGSAITFTKDKNGSIALAPARAPKAIENTIFEVRLNDENGREADNLFLTAREEAKNEYEIGRDVAKMSMGTAKCAQMWVPAYGTQLCAADFQLVNDKAEYPLVINTPAAGTYTMSTVANENADIYLTYEGSIIWNLSMGAYEIELAKGATNGYGLLLQAKAPGVATGVDNVQGDNVQCTKIIIDDHVYILRGGQLFGIDGKAVK